MTRRDRARKHEQRRAHANRSDHRVVEVVPIRNTKPPQRKRRRLRGRV